MKWAIKKPQISTTKEWLTGRLSHRDLKRNKPFSKVFAVFHPDSFYGYALL
jgi:hypothetical protein